MEQKYWETNKCLAEFIKNSPVSYWAVENIKNRLEKEGYVCLDEKCAYQVKKGGKYYVERNGTSILAFSIGKELASDAAFHIVAAHDDSPSYKIKPVCDGKVGNYQRVNVEPYGGMICSTWFDRPLSFAGRVYVEKDGKIIRKLVDAKKPMLLIPNLPIHLNRDVNTGYRYQANVDMQPVLGQMLDKEPMKQILAKLCECKEEEIQGFDLFLYLCEDSFYSGWEESYFSSPRLDDLQCVFSALEAFCSGKNEKDINVLAVFDNEEVGSKTRQGADTTFLEDNLKRVLSSLGYQESDYPAFIARSFCISADNAHAVHPNHSELYDADNRVYLNHGIVIKQNAAQSYATDGMTSSILEMICKEAKVPTQYFTNRADMRGGSTLGNLSASHVAIATVDIGLPQWAMHSTMETCGSEDTYHAIEMMKKFYQAHFVWKDDEILLQF